MFSDESLSHDAGCIQGSQKEILNPKMAKEIDMDKVNWPLSFYIEISFLWFFFSNMFIKTSLVYGST